ncbi:MAG: hypothetical protein BWY83_00242 [bacterium ADurb.Bin478]|nr:MAG: hypothetical protein BWY83_00242 [bacterium ADurb.Bin478]
MGVKHPYAGQTIAIRFRGTHMMVQEQVNIFLRAQHLFVVQIIHFHRRPGFHMLIKLQLTDHFAEMRVGAVLRHQASRRHTYLAGGIASQNRPILHQRRL